MSWKEIVKEETLADIHDNEVLCEMKPEERTASVRWLEWCLERALANATCEADYWDRYTALVDSTSPRLMEEMRHAKA